ncbi:hypothetical protein [Absidia glauca]|uniref:thioredoxin-dependent peroxiredoxin n=1 Tax=Absidia glauca TaxID=4829 RepID=A0A168RRE3_ABSGL|nr:hypothetical protein [Absidia glauca]
MFALRRAASALPRTSRSLYTLNNSLGALRPAVNASLKPSKLNHWRAMSNFAGETQRAFIQQPAPQWTAPAVSDGEFKDISLSDYKGKYVVFFWYPMDFTFVCPTEIIAFSDRISEFEALDCAVIGASTDSEFSHLAWINTPRKQGGLGEMKIPLVADKTKAIAKNYGVLLEDAGVALRGLFIIDPKGVLRQITINDLPVGRSVDEVLRLVKAFKFTDEHGEVCPAGWNQGDKTIKPSVKDSKEYFSTQ